MRIKDNHHRIFKTKILNQNAGTYLCETPSFPEPEAAFPPSPALPPTIVAFPEVPLDFLGGALSFASWPFPSNSGFVCVDPGVCWRIEQIQLTISPIILNTTLIYRGI